MIYRSVRKGRFCDTIVHWTAHRIARDRQFKLDVIEPRDDAEQAFRTSS
jgi:hypothetical protein